VLPVSVISHWMTEMSKWLPNVTVRVFHGPVSQREEEKRELMSGGGVLVTTYGLIPTSFESLMEGEHEWDYIILDEGHKIKNPSIKLTKSIKEIRSKHRLLLSGTPIQNNLHEMWSLFDYTCPGLLGTYRTFKGEFENSINAGSHKKATQEEVDLGKELAAQLKILISPFFLRREKSAIFSSTMISTPPKPNVDKRTTSPKTPSTPSQKQLATTPTTTIAKIPISNASPRTPNSSSTSHFNNFALKSQKNDFVVWVPITKPQIECYNSFLETGHVRDLLVNPSESPLVAIMILKKICNHPVLLHKGMSTLEGMQLPSYLSDVPEDSKETPIKNMEISKIIELSGKLSFLVTLLQQLRIEGHRTVIFSQSLKMLDLIERVLESIDMSFLRIDGKVSCYTERQRLIQLYNTEVDNYFCFLLTTQVGGLGISLTTATRVVIFDPSWNLVDDQAVDRVYRIGQKKNVVIYRLITCGTIEEKIYRKQVFKGSLMKKVMERRDPYRYFTSEELRDLLKLDDTSVSETQMQLSELHGSQRKTYPDLDLHLKFLQSLDIFGVSDHDLLFSKTNDDIPVSSPAKRIAELAKERIVSQTPTVIFFFFFLTSRYPYLLLNYVVFSL
jgi:DNA excision repair protein ERCC-6-like